MNGEGPGVTRVRSLYQGKRILVVDDDEDARYFDCIMLSRAGYIVDTATDGEEAWKMLLSNSYDLLLSDHNMPRLCGLDLVRRIRAAGMTLPIIINSGFLGLGETSNHARLELAAILHKPFEFAEVLDAVKRVLPLPQNAVESVYNKRVAISKVVPLQFASSVPAPARPAGPGAKFT